MRKIGILFCLLISCIQEPQPFAYGTDSCHYCQMIIVAKPFAAQFITEKGKVYKYDAIECLVNEGLTHGTPYINDYFTHKPIPAETAFYVIHDSIRSPMGGHLAGFKSLSHGISWETLLQQLD